MPPAKFTADLEGAGKKQRSRFLSIDKVIFEPRGEKVVISGQLPVRPTSRKLRKPWHGAKEDPGPSVAKEEASGALKEVLFG